MRLTVLASLLVRACSARRIRSSGSIVKVVAIVVFVLVGFALSLAGLGWKAKYGGYTIDAADARPGRLDQKITVELPDKAACPEILARQLLAAERRKQRILVADELALDEIGDY